MSLLIKTILCIYNTHTKNNCYSEGSLHHIDHISEEICPCWLIIDFKLDCCTERMVSSFREGVLHPTDDEPVIASSVTLNKDGTAADSCIALVGAHQCM